jgi:hypothetical protein
MMTPAAAGKKTTTAAVASHGVVLRCCHRGVRHCRRLCCWGVHPRRRGGVHPRHRNSNRGDPPPGSARGLNNAIAILDGGLSNGGDDAMWMCYNNGNIFLFPERQHISVMLGKQFFFPQWKHISVFYTEKETYFCFPHLFLFSTCDFFTNTCSYLNFTLMQVPQHGSAIKEDEIKQQTGRRYHCWFRWGSKCC